MREFISKLRCASGLTPRKRHIQGASVRLDLVQRLPTLRALAYLLVPPPNKLDATEQEVLAKHASVHPNLQTLRELAQAFDNRAPRRASEFPAWLDKAPLSSLCPP